MSNYLLGLGGAFIFGTLVYYALLSWAESADKRQFKSTINFVLKVGKDILLVFGILLLSGAIAWPITVFLDTLTLKQGIIFVSTSLFLSIVLGFSILATRESGA